MKRGAAAIVLLAAVVALPSLRNGFVYDDVLLIVENPLLHTLSRSAEIWQTSYWPTGGLYRPLTVQLFAIEWAVGSGRPIVFHAMSMLLSAVVAVLVFRLAARILPPNRTDLPGRLAPATAAAFFAVHPVHVEVVANAVGQSELLTALWALLAVERYVAWRAAGELTLMRRLGLAGLTLLGIMCKETGYVIPLLLAAAELTVAGPKRGSRLGSAFALQGAVVAAALLWRLTELGTLAGDQPITVLRDLGIGARAVAMLAIVPEWARLLLWPARLQAEYGPPGLPVDPTPGPAHLAGLALLGLAGVVAWRVRRRQPVLTFGVLWVLIGLAPVSNVLAATGIVLAERTLYLPSIGVVLALGSMISAARPRLAGAPALARKAVLGAGLGLFTAALLTSLERQEVWRSQERFFGQLVRDAPRSYRAQFVASRFYYGQRRWAEAEAAAREALALYPLDPQVHEQLGQVLRVQDRCEEATAVLERGLQLNPGGTTIRSRLIECALAVGDSGRARAVAEEAVRLGQTEFRATLERLAR